jgi:adenylate kinase
MSKIVVLMGAPGAGKGTQARLIQERLRLPQISTGDILRAFAETSAARAEEVRSIQASGKLISDDLVMHVVRERTARDDCQAGYVLDGFPRTRAQASMLEDLAVEQGKGIVAITIEVPVEVLEERMTGRRVCPLCGELYNIYFRPPKSDETCDNDTGVRLVHRVDDTIEKVRVRLKTYDEETHPLVAYYEKSKRLRRVDGTKQPEALYQEIEEIIAEKVS